MVGAGFWTLKTYNLQVTGFCNSLPFHLDQYLGSSYEGWMPSDDVWNRSRLGGQLQVFWSEFVRIILRLNNNRCPWIVERVEGPSNSLTIIPCLSGFYNKRYTNVRLQVEKVENIKHWFQGPQEYGMRWPVRLGEQNCNSKKSISSHEAPPIVLRRIRMQTGRWAKGQCSQPVQRGKACSPLEKHICFWKEVPIQHAVSVAETQSSLTGVQ